jgi:hypothetical protein
VRATATASLQEEGSIRQLQDALEPILDLAEVVFFGVSQISCVGHVRGFFSLVSAEKEFRVSMRDRGTAIVKCLVRILGG